MMALAIAGIVHDDGFSVYNILVMRQEKLLLVRYKTTEPTTSFFFSVALPSFLLTHITRSRRGEGRLDELRGAPR